MKGVTAYYQPRYSLAFLDILLPAEKEKEEYLADVIQVLCAADS